MNSMHHPDGFKLGLFGYLHEGGNSITTVPERWPAHWPDIVRMARYADDSGLDFLLPIARWKGIPGIVTNRLHSFETLTHAAALANVTSRITLFATVHTPIIHPIVAAKGIVTIDHASDGRAGLNIVCGWNQDDFDMFGLHALPHDDRYAQGGEWYDIWSRLVAGAPEPFDHDGRHFPGLTGVSGMPAAVQQPRPVVISAAYSDTGRDFAVKTSDFLLTVLENPQQGQREIADIARRAERAGRADPPRCLAAVTVVCRQTREAAIAFHRYYAEEHADTLGVDYYLKSRQANAKLPEAVYQEQRVRMAAGIAGYPLIGNPQDVADGLMELQAAGYSGVAMMFLNYLDDVSIFVERVMPILTAAKLR